MVYLLLILFFLSIVLEGTVTTLPLVLVCLICLTIFLRSPFMFFLAFLAGILLDAFALRSLGETSIFLLFFVFLILLYKRKYEINTYPFVLISSCVGSLLYLLVFGYHNVIWTGFGSAIIAVFLFGSLRYLYKFSIKN